MNTHYFGGGRRLDSDDSKDGRRRTYSSAGRAQYVKPVAPGHHQIQNNEVRLYLLDHHRALHCVQG